MSNFRREIYAARVEAAGPGLLRFEVHGQAFLWHMVRCLVAIIELVGDGLEAPDVVDALLDVARSPRRPQYALADEAPLVLHDCAFDTVRPAPTPEALLQLHEHLTRERHAARVALARTENLLEKLDGFGVRAAGAEVPWAQARPPLLAAADERARGAPAAARARGRQDLRGEGRGRAREPDEALEVRGLRVAAVGEPRGVPRGEAAVWLTPLFLGARVCAFLVSRVTARDGDGVGARLSVRVEGWPSPPC